MDDRLVVVGGSIAALAAADAASRRGREVQLLVPAGRVGSGFLPLHRGARRLDLGPRIIELGYDDLLEASPALEHYVPGPHGHRPFLGLIDALVRDLVGEDLRLITPPEITRGGVRARDFVLGGDLIDLPKLLRDDERERVAAEAGEIAERLGPAGLLADEEVLGRLSLEEASLGMHGPTFHAALLGPLAAKVLPEGGAGVIAGLRRKIWLPLLWPQSLAEACLGTLSYRPERPMYTVVGGGMGAVVERLLGRLHAHPGVEVRTVGGVRALARSDGRTRVDFDDETSVQASDVVLALGSAGAFRLAGWTGGSERVRGVFVWLDVPREHLGAPASVLFVGDADVPAFRVSENTGDHEHERTTLVCELAPTVADDAAPAVAAETLARVGIVGPGAAVEVVDVLAGPSFAAPSFENRARHAEGLAALRRADLPVDVIGVEVFGADSFNEQVVQGLAAADRWS